MFYDIYVSLCEEKKIKPSAAANKMGINRAAVTYWKGHNVVPSGDVLQKVANFFDVSTDYLLGNTDIKNKPTAEIGGELSELLQEPMNLEFYKLFSSLSRNQQEKILSDMMWLKSQQESEE